MLQFYRRSPPVFLASEGPPHLISLVELISTQEELPQILFTLYTRLRGPCEWFTNISAQCLQSQHAAFTVDRQV